MDKREIAKLLEEIGLLLELKGEPSDVINTLGPGEVLAALRHRDA